MLMLKNPVVFLKPHLRLFSEYVTANVKNWVICTFSGYDA